MSVPRLLTMARKVELYLLDSATWDTTILYEWVVPTGKRWFVMGGMINRDVSATVTVAVTNAATVSIFSLLSEAAATGIHEWPDTSKINWPYSPLVMDAGDKIRFAFGVAQSTAAYITGWVLEVDA